MNEERPRARPLLSVCDPNSDVHLRSHKACWASCRQSSRTIQRKFEKSNRGPNGPKRVKMSNYAESHPSVRISAKRFRQSPYFHCYADANAILGVYGKRFYALSLGEDPVSRYWALRRHVVLYDVPERPVEISGPDAIRLLEQVFTRKVANLPVGRARYAIACLPGGGILMDGVLLRLERDRFWYVHADGEFDTWLIARGLGMEVSIRDPDSWVLQVQGPRSLDVLAAACDDGMPDAFNYFNVRECRLGNQSLLVSRTGEKTDPDGTFFSQWLFAHRYWK